MPKQDMPTIEDFLRDGMPVSPDGYFVGHLIDYRIRQNYSDYRDPYRWGGYPGLG